MDQVRLGVIGLGNMGASHVKKVMAGLCPDAIVTAVCDNAPQKLDASRALYGDQLVYFDNAYDLFDSGLVDAVVIAVPHYDHPTLSIAAMRKGLHVMVEKPAGVYTKHVLEMNRVADECNVVFGIMMNQRTNFLYRKMREIVQSGEMGNIRRTSWIVTDWYRPQSYYDSGDWRATWSGEGGGVLLNQCPHNLDLWQWICGMPKTIEAKLHFGKWHDIEVEDDVTIYAEYENGATGTFIASTGDAPGSNRFEITLEKGKIIVEDNALRIYKAEDDLTEPEYSALNLPKFSDRKFIQTTIEQPEKPAHHMGVLRAFTGAILRGEPLLADGREGIRGLTISNAAHLSAFTGKKIELASFDHELFYEELMKRVATSRRKTTATEQVITDMDSTF